jgi:hypothetical protein
VSPLTVSCVFQKIFKKFFRLETCRKKGTLSFFKGLLHRTNVSGQVKGGAAFEPHKDFACMIARELILELTRMTIGDTVESWCIPHHIRTWSSEKKLSWLLHKLQPVVEEVFVSFPVSDFGVQVHSDSEVVHVKVDGHEYVVVTPIENSDELFNSSMSFLLVMNEFMLFDYIIRIGDVNSIPAVLKRLAAIFDGLTSNHSKYAIECMNLITKLEWVLPEKEKVKVLLRSLVNPMGKSAGNKPADMQQENNIKMIKNVFRGMGAGKLSKQALHRASRAAPAINTIATQFQSSFQIHVAPTKFEHSKKSSETDQKLVREVLQREEPFINVHGRCVGLNVSPSVLKDVCPESFVQLISNNSRRALNQLDFALDMD